MQQCIGDWDYHHYTKSDITYGLDILLTASISSRCQMNNKSGRFCCPIKSVV